MNVKKYVAYIVAITGLTFVGSCIKNDVPYPRIQPNFLSFSVADQENAAVIDSASRTVTVTLDESIDIYAVRVNSYTITPGATLLDDIFTEPVDLSSPISVILSYYQDYTWTIQANQDIERYFEIEDQIGSSAIDVPGRRIVAQVPQSSSLSALKIVRAKLANEGATISPDISQGGVIDASAPVSLRVEVFDHVQEWTLYVETAEQLVTTASADAWTNVLWIYGEAQAGADNGAQYRKSGDQTWTDVPQGNITHSGGSFVARVDHVEAGTTYEVRAVSGENTGSTLTVTTGTVEQLPNSDFDSWWLDGKIWCPWVEGETAYWGTGNKGATTLGSSNTVPTDDTVDGNGQAAMLETKFVGIGSIGKLAAGNLFVGEYVRTDGTNGVLSFGRSFAQRPTALTGYYKYTGVDITHADDAHKSIIGQPDTCIIWCALLDSDQPFEIRTNPKDRQLFDENGSAVIAYGKLEQSQPVSGYTQFRIELDYKSTSRTPTYILVTASASKYGDYFTGGSGSILYIDNFSLEYDY